MNLETTFWKLINQYKIQIPIIQRDYAQGRKGKEYLRSNFLTKLKDALDGRGELKIDFVYGSTEVEGNKKILKPLDGQQRLTTLWLLHWFIAFKAGKLKEENVYNILSKFTYETRNSSKDFCEALIHKEKGIKLKPEYFNKKIENLKEITINVLKDGNKDKEESLDLTLLKEKLIKRISQLPIKDIHEININTTKDNILREDFVSTLIQNQTWFYSGWNQDPTIQGILRMLGGSYNPKSDGTDEIDGLEEIFVGCSIKQYRVYWDKLVNEDKCPIVFYHLPIKDFGLSDDLYIKMNARGKALSDFENFKADLIGYIEDMSNNEENTEEEKNKWKSLIKPLDKNDETSIDYSTTLPYKLDNDWTDIFWEHCFNSKEQDKKDKNGRIDEIFYAFINRFFWTEVVLQKDKKDIRHNPTFEHLNEPENIEESSLPLYVGLNKYKFSNETKNTEKEKLIPLEVFQDLITVLDKYKNHKVDIDSFFDKRNEKKSDNENYNNTKEFYFIPRYGEDTKIITKIGQIDRILFFAVFKFLKEGDFDKSVFDRWMRVIQNLISGIDEKGRPQIRTITSMINTIRKIEELRSHDVYNSLNTYVKTTFFDKKGKLKETLSDFELRVKEEWEKAEKIKEEINKNSTVDWEKLFMEAEEIPEFHHSIQFLYHNENGEPVDWDNFQNKLSLAKRNFCIDNSDNPSMKNLLRKFLKAFNEEEFQDNINNDLILIHDDKIMWLNIFLNLSASTHNFFLHNITEPKEEKSVYNAVQDDETLLNYVLKFKNLTLGQLKAVCQVWSSKDIEKIQSDENLIFKFEGETFEWDLDGKIYHVINDKKEPKPIIDTSKYEVQEIKVVIKEIVTTKESSANK